MQTIDSDQKSHHPVFPPNVVVSSGNKLIMCSIKLESTVYISIPGDYFESDNFKLMVFEQQTTGTSKLVFKSSNNMKINRTMLRKRKLCSRLKTDLCRKGTSWVL